MTQVDPDALRPRLTAALEEDLGPGDVTSAALVPADATAEAALVARQAGVICGLPLVPVLLDLVDQRCRFKPAVEDGARVQAGTILGTVRGPLSAILAVERTMLNFLQHLSGIATLTARYVDAVAGTGAVIVDTRKTTPGWRDLEKYAVRMGGGRNHRMGLYGAVLIKDNHIDGTHLALADAVRRARQHVAQAPPPVEAPAEGGRATFIEIEVRSLDQLRAVLPAGPDIVMPDNFSVEQLREAVELVRAWRRKSAQSSAVSNRRARDHGVRPLPGRERVGVRVDMPPPLIEASGGITLETVRAIAETGVDRIAVGALTHSAPALDIALDVVRQGAHPGPADVQAGA